MGWLHSQEQWVGHGGHGDRAPACGFLLIESCPCFLLTSSPSQRDGPTQQQDGPIQHGHRDFSQAALSFRKVVAHPLPPCHTHWQVIVGDGFTVSCSSFQESSRPSLPAHREFSSCGEKGWVPPATSQQRQSPWGGVGISWGPLPSLSVLSGYLFALTGLSSFQLSVKMFPLPDRGSCQLKDFELFTYVSPAPAYRLPF